MDPRSIVNNAYHSAVLSGLVLSNSVLARKLLNMKSVDLDQFSVKDGAVLSLKGGYAHSNMHIFHF